MAQQAQVSEEQARALAEESRESGWDKPSFAKELFLGRFPLELIHPFPKPSEDDEAHTRAFLEKLREFLDTVDGRVIERDAQIPDQYVKGLFPKPARSASCPSGVEARKGKTLNCKAVDATGRRYVVTLHIANEEGRVTVGKGDIKALDKPPPLGTPPPSG